MNKTATPKKSVQINFKQERQINETVNTPTALTISNILNYSKALSIRRLKMIDFAEFVLN